LIWRKKYRVQREGDLNTKIPKKTYKNVNNKLNDSYLGDERDKLKFLLFSFVISLNRRKRIV